MACLGFARLLKSFQTKSLPKLVHVASDVVTADFQETVEQKIDEQTEKLKIDFPNSFRISSGPKNLKPPISI